MTQLDSTTAMQWCFDYNGKGERVRKHQTIPATAAPSPPPGRYFVYDETGRMLGDYGNVGSTAGGLREWVWIDDTPVAVLHKHKGNLVAAAGNYSWIMSDHLNTPRALVKATGSNPNTVIWQWSLGIDAFGEKLPNENPDNDANNYTANLRFPGQYFDSETGLHYNYFRDYEAGVGRYVQSDPIGLLGGINHFSYVLSQPLGLVDPNGLEGVGSWTAAPPPTSCDFEKGCAAAAFRRNYLDMREANWKMQDKYFHCKANCEAAKCGKCGYDHACLISDSREEFDETFKGDSPADVAADQAANVHGRDNAVKNPSQSCAVTCGVFRPLGLPSKY